MMKPRLVLCSGAQVPEGSSLRDGRHLVELDTLTEGSNTHLRLYNVTKFFAPSLSARFVDLLEIATYVYTADCEASRELAWVEDKSTEPWSRDFHFVMPVRELDFWQRADVQTSLVKALEFLSSDRFTFEFCPLIHDRASETYLEQLGDDDLTPFKGVERVIMFSGGLDSLAGAAETANRGDPLVLVSHTPVSGIRGRQRDLFLDLKETYKGKAQMMHLPVWVNKSGHDGESTQRTRSFLFSALGAAVANVLGAGGVRFYENGVISLNLPLAEEALRSRASRTTNPHSLKLLQDLHRLASDNDDFVIDNPFIFNTKAEVVSKIAENGAAELIGRSCSCSHTMFQTKTQRHCGRCGQCIDRRIAILANEQEANDPDTDYQMDVFTGERPLNPDRPYDHNIAANYVRFARDIDRMSESGIASFYSTEIARASRGFPDRTAAAREFIAMHKRHAETVMDAVEDQFRRESHSFAHQSIPDTSLLYMAIARETAGPGVASNSELDRVPASNGNSFLRSGDYWVVSFKGQEVHLRDSKGCQYMAFLLAHPCREYYALQVVHEISGAPYSPDAALSALSAVQLAELGLSVSGFTDVGETIDEPYEKTCRDGLKEAQRRLEAAKERSDAAGARQANSDIDHYRRILGEGIGLGGRHRSVGNAHDKARTSLKHAISAVLKKLQSQHTPLYEHLSGSLHTGAKCHYSPTTPTNWTF